MIVEAMQSLNLTLEDGLIEPQCLVSSTKWTNIVLITVMFISGLINLIVWLAATIYRRKLLRQNYVYLCVTSLLLSNLVFLTLNLWDEFSSYLLKPEVSLNPPNQGLQVLWALCQSGSVAMLFVMCGNILALVYVLLDSAYFHHARNAPAVGIGNEENTAKILQVKRRKAIGLISISWFIPLVLVIAAVLKWNCAARCQCSLGAMGDVCPVSDGCSRVWSPLFNSYIGLNVGLWLLEVVSLFILTSRGVLNFVSFTRAPPIRSQIASELNDSLPGLNECGRATTDCDVGNDVTDVKQSTNAERSRPIARRVTWFHLTPRLRLVALIGGLFFVCTLPLVMTFFIDVGGAQLVTPAARVTSMLCIYIYCLLVPILLVKYMANLKLALVKLLTFILCCFQ
uniref:Uncharacterized LOC100175595 n=1 Tax=Ciona intestinalis TaxID=7719 RepID=H2XXY2_CIOIN|nr:uncharacterized protein LOC100175595 [Ciona intestinalis]|eukprot:XP_002124549.1 uncharacterized protein LOC100175595 [Ciona intestinalis]